MKSQILIFRTILGVLIIFSMSSCDKKNSYQVGTSSLNVKVLHSGENFELRVIEGAEVGVIDVRGDTIQTGITNEEGIATFTELKDGEYDIYATYTLSEEETLNLLGFSCLVYLSGHRDNVPLPIPPDVTIEIELILDNQMKQRQNDFVINEIYYAGCYNTPTGNYNGDQFIELYNNSPSDTLYLDGLCIADIYGEPGQVDISSQPTPFQSDKDHVYANNVWAFPGTGKDYPIPPHSYAVIVQDAKNHRIDPNNDAYNLSDLDLTEAKWEVFVEGTDDFDSPTAVNLTPLYCACESDWILDVYGPAIVLFKTDNFDALETVSISGTNDALKVKIPVHLVIDAVEALKDADSYNYKRIPVELDYGFTYVSGTFNRESIERVRDFDMGLSNYRTWSLDTNNSLFDFSIRERPNPNFY